MAEGCPYYYRGKKCTIFRGHSNPHRTEDGDLWWPTEKGQKEVWTGSVTAQEQMTALAERLEALEEGHRKTQKRLEEIVALHPPYLARLEALERKLAIDPWDLREDLEELAERLEAVEKRYVAGQVPPSSDLTLPREQQDGDLWKAAKSWKDAFFSAQDGLEAERLGLEAERLKVKGLKQRLEKISALWGSGWAVRSVPQERTNDLRFMRDDYWKIQRLLGLEEEEKHREDLL